jgi:hypothetical protein
MTEPLSEINKNRINDEIVNEDWPLLNELESTRFSLKNKKLAKKETTISKIKELSEKEDELIASQNMNDERLMEAFFEGSKPEESKVTLNNDVQEKNNLSRSSVADIEQRFQREPSIQANVSQSIGQQPQMRKEEVRPNIINKPIITKEQSDEELTKLVAKGLGKVFMDKTNNLLSPLKFLVINSNRIAIGLLQFLIPILLTWFFINYIDIIKAVLAKETQHTRYLYIAIFYFACLFISITAQVVISGIINVFKMIFNNLAVEAKK